MNLIRNLYCLQKCNIINSNVIKLIVQNRLSNEIIPCSVQAYSTRIILDKPIRRQTETRKQEVSKLQLKDDPDKFGTLNSAKILDEDDEIDEGDVKEEEYLKNPKRRALGTKQYANMIKDHLNNNRLYEAIEVLEKIMIEEDRTQPENYIFNLLIAGCAKAGYTKKAFQLYNKMKQRGLKVTGGTYTSLFNACANSPWPNDCLIKANLLREILIEKSYEPNEMNYNAMIKAYGRGGDITTAFQLADAMADKNLEIRLDTFNFLLQACASDKEHGFRHSLIIWRKLHQKRLNPDIYSFNLLLRCVRDCGIGDLETTEKVLEQLLIKETPSQSKRLLELSDGNNKLEISKPASDVVTSSQSIDCTPNLISNTPRLGNLVAISEILKPEDRLLLIGGITGFLEEMKAVNVTPNIVTFTELLEVAPATLSAEKKILSFIRKIGLKTDIDFFNMLIKKRSMRFDYASAREVLSMIQTAKLKPDIITYGVLALGCQTYEEAQNLLAEMATNGVRMNIQILGAMLRQGCYKRNFDYIFGILEIMKKENIKPNDQFLKHLDAFAKSSRSFIKQKHPNANKNFKRHFNRFLSIYDAYLNELDIKGLSLDEAMKKVKGKPYEQFKKPNKEGYEPNKNEGLLQKRKPMKYINRIKIDDLKDDVVKLNE